MKIESFSHLPFDKNTNIKSTLTKTMLSLFEKLFENLGGRYLDWLQECDKRHAQEEILKTKNNRLHKCIDEQKKIIDFQAELLGEFSVENEGKKDRVYIVQKEIIDSQAKKLVRFEAENDELKIEGDKLRAKNDELKDRVEKWKHKKCTTGPEQFFYVFTGFCITIGCTTRETTGPVTFLYFTAGTYTVKFLMKCFI